MQLKGTLLIILFALLFSSLAVFAGENRGDEMLTLEGGKQGSVAFPHYQHQDNLKDCQICHGVFPQKKGAIEEMKVQGKLKSKAVMNKQCVKCHRSEKKAGNPSGPLTCTTCHQK